jgi:3-hydroxyacyl-[acyl-carrier-protein] dehydratase
MEFPRTDIELFIPQRQPVIMIGSLQEVTENRAVTQFRIDEGCIFVSGGRLLEPGLIENIAQTIAAGAGYRAVSLNKPVRLGYIAAVRDLVIHALPLVGETLSTRAEIVNEVLNVTIVHAEIWSGLRCIAGGEMRIFLEEENLNEIIS